VIVWNQNKTKFWTKLAERTSSAKIQNLFHPISTGIMNTLYLKNWQYLTTLCKKISTWPVSKYKPAGVKFLPTLTWQYNRSNLHNVKPCVHISRSSNAIYCIYNALITYASKTQTNADTEIKTININSEQHQMIWHTIQRSSPDEISQ